jgi:redox-sensitive bicupin YhaK (pirin superfamily)
MCDFFGPMESDGISTEDEFPIGWHPHRGFDICTYLSEGIGRHADSMGNRETFSAPGMQWCSVGSGIEHAEGGGTPAGDNTTGFQIWVNVPASNKMDPPSYGTVPADRLPVVSLPNGVVARVLAGPLGDVAGPFKTKVDVQMIHWELPAGAELAHDIPATMDNAMAFVFRGDVTVPSGAAKIAAQQIGRFDAADAGGARTIRLIGGFSGAGVMLFAGKMLKQPISWRGPIVMNTADQVAQAFAELRNGDFPPVRAPWNYKRLSDFPADHPARVGGSK